MLKHLFSSHVAASVQQTMQHLIQDVEAADLDTARNLAIETLRFLNIDRGQLDIALRRVAEQRSKEKLVGALRALAPFLAEQAKKRAKRKEPKGQ